MDVINMEVKIKQDNEMLDATIEMVDGVMVVSPKKEKVDITKFQDGDVITCGWDDGNQRYNWTGILQVEIECISDNMFIGDYCSLDCKGEFLDHNSGSDSATWVRYATEEEKKILFDKLKEEGYEWKPDTKELVKLKWKPKVGEIFYTIAGNTCSNNIFFVESYKWVDDSRDNELYSRRIVFKIKEECQEFCNRLNKAIEGIKP